MPTFPSSPPKIPYGGFSLGTAPKLAYQTGPSLIARWLSLLPSGQTHARMTIAISTDYGLTWKIAGPIITGTDPPAGSKETGDSCVAVVLGEDGYDYAYCLHNGGHSWDGCYAFIARAVSSVLNTSGWRSAPSILAALLHRNRYPYRSTASKPALGG
jgi:hypothetical protein